MNKLDSVSVTNDGLYVLNGKQLTTASIIPTPIPTIAPVGIPDFTVSK
jgi:hypothetical protein